MGKERNNAVKKNGEKSRFSKIIGWLHLWLGLISGVIVLFVSITGCLFVFQKEISELIHKDKLFVTPAQTATLPLSVLQEKAQAALGKDKPIRNITTYRSPDKAWEFMAYKPGPKDALTYFGSIDHYESAFVNPYNGAITGIHDYKYDFFVLVKNAHWSLLLSTPIGQPIVGWSTLIFVILLITGLVLWWPKKWSKANRDKSFKIKWTARFKRLNYDLHNVLGFYSLLLALVLALTGMVWSFTWFESLVYMTAAGTTAPPQYKEVKSDSLQLTASTNPLDIAYATAVKELPGVKRIGVNPASPAADATIGMYGYWGEEVYYDRDDLRFDKYTGKLLLRETAANRNAGQKLIGMNYDIHVGAIGGLPGKIIAFIISLICASLPVTGFYVWWNKRNKKPAGKKQPEKFRKIKSSATPAVPNQPAGSHAS